MKKIHQDRRKAYETPLQLNVNILRQGYEANYATPRNDKNLPKKIKLNKYIKNLSIGYDSFLKVVLNFQLEKHLSMIEPIYKLVRC
jgi:hypothetical protein